MWKFRAQTVQTMDGRLPENSKIENPDILADAGVITDSNPIQEL